MKLAKTTWLLPVITLLLLGTMPLASAAPDFPALTGRVVDQAGLLTAPQKAALTKQLAAEERASSNQIVVVTLKSLQGYDISTYGYQLGRHWGIGQKKHDNGVLLIVAPKEHKVRIEVGYGLEGSLTDALSSVIIRQDIIPAFKKGNFYQGIENGVTAITKVIHGQYKAKPGTNTPHKRSLLSRVISLVFFMIFISFMFSGRGGIFFFPFLMMGGGGFRGGLGGGGLGGFTGGGGGFGGGGAAGGW